MTKEECKRKTTNTTQNQTSKHFELDLSSECVEILEEISVKDSKPIEQVAKEIIEHRATRILKRGYLDGGESR